MGIPDAVGRASTEAHLAAAGNKPGMGIIDRRTYCIFIDDCAREGIFDEA